MDNNRFKAPIWHSAWQTIESNHYNNAYNINNDGSKNNLYIIAGAFGNDWSNREKSRAPRMPRGTTDLQNFQDNNIHVPEWTWKVAVITNSVDADITTETTKTYAYLTPNIPEPHEANENDPWPQDGVEHPFKAFLNLSTRGNIMTPQDWRKPSTWQLTVAELQNILNAHWYYEDFEFDFLSELDDNLVNNLTQQLNRT
ncbi:DNA/RNA non-specific endonuclease [Spirulina sp. 06S082]|uniref:DNA/RNA non-specific endonuclease n=1 Tax=Spirulina sp. 06S082 TaxID=3110248 RepID=UPI002B206351|nr:DNA/RNA non-specific endonuclease [Spirulina sp. 06S082]MEA5471934.1 DNA/RNA non-specific endonuclease [Spirulina sp. 06S082]